MGGTVLKVLRALIALARGWCALRLDRAAYPSQLGILLHLTQQDKHGRFLGFCSRIEQHYVLRLYLLGNVV